MKNISKIIIALLTSFSLISSVPPPLLVVKNDESSFNHFKLYFWVRIFICLGCLPIIEIILSGSLCKQYKSEISNNKAVWFAKQVKYRSVQ